MVFPKSTAKALDLQTLNFSPIVLPTFVTKGENKMLKFFLRKLWRYIPLYLAVGAGLVFGFYAGSIRNGIFFGLIGLIAYLSVPVYGGYLTRKEHLLFVCYQESFDSTFQLSKAAEKIRSNLLLKITAHSAMVVFLLHLGIEWHSYSLWWTLLIPLSACLIAHICICAFDWSGYHFVWGMPKRPLNPNLFSWITTCLTTIAFGISALTMLV